MNSIYSDNENELLRQLVAGNEAAFDVVYKKYADPVKRFILQYMKSAELTDDLVQEVFIKLWEKRLVLSSVQSLKAYLFVMARNHTLNILKRAANEKVLMAEIIRNYPNMGNNARDTVLLKEYKKHLHQILESLPPKTREVFYLCRECEKSYEDAAALLGISKHAVKKHMVRSMKAFKKEIDIPVILLLIDYMPL